MVNMHHYKNLKKANACLQNHLNDILDGKEKRDEICTPVLDVRCMICRVLTSFME
jgi:hypothetical protein